MAAQSNPDPTQPTRREDGYTPGSASSCNGFSSTDPPASKVLLGDDFDTLSGPEQTARLAGLA
jgi:hypothetical protein